MKDLYTIRDVANRIQKDKHTAWYHIKRLKLGTRIGNQILLTGAEVEYLEKNAVLYDRKRIS